MKKLLLLTFLSFKYLSSASYDRLERAFYYPHTPRRPCHKTLTDESLSGFSQAYRKKIGNEYLKQMIEDQKQEVLEKKAKTAPQKKIEKPTKTLSSDRLKIKSVLDYSNDNKLPLLPLRPACIPMQLKTPRKAQELGDLLVITSLLPELIYQPKLDLFEVNPKR